jgi:hypothetical protein
MKSLPLALALLAGTALAGDSPYAFRPGQTWTWECTSYFHYSTSHISKDAGGLRVGDPPPETNGTKQPPTDGKNPPCY